MKKCPNCTYTTGNDEKFCPSCGGELIVEAKAEVVPAQENPGKKKALLGMIFSIAGLHKAFVSIITNLLLLLFGSSLVIPIVAPALSIVGLIFSGKSRKQGDTSTFSRLGKTLGVVGVIVDIIHILLIVLLYALAIALILIILLTEFNDLPR